MRNCCAFIALALMTSTLMAANPVITKVEKTADGGYQFTRDGQPYFVHGAGGDASKELLKQSGGNSFRTWGADDLSDQLDEAQKLGLTVAAGMWLQHASDNWKYSDPAAVKKQFDLSCAVIQKYKNEPAVLVWSIGNEMEGYKDGDDPNVWKAIEDIAGFAHENDPNHPTMTVIADIGGQRVQSIQKYCPDIDIIGINSYGAAPTLAQRYRAVGGTRPFMLTEFGPPGSWESTATEWKAPLELTSTAKGDYYRLAYEKTVLAEKGKLCLGSYAFAWGNKREATATWYGMFLPDKSRLEALDVMSALWTEQPLTKHCPQLEPLTVDRNSVDPGQPIHVTLKITPVGDSPLHVKWLLQQDPAQYNTNGETQPEPESYPDSVIRGDLQGCDLKMPSDGGGFWLYAYVTDDKGDAAVADIPLHVSGPPPKPHAIRAELPLVLYADGIKDLPYVWSGWMGTVADINMDEHCTDNPHTGKVCMKCQFTAKSGFGGIVWQSPTNDWGNLVGGYNLTGAKRLTFWARGENGNETVSFKVGIIGPEKPYPDSVRRNVDQTLTREWKQYTIDLHDKDLSCIKTGFGWSVVAQGSPITFYLDDVQYE